MKADYVDQEAETTKRAWLHTIVDFYVFKPLASDGTIAFWVEDHLQSRH